MKTRRHRAIMWAYTGHKHKHRVTYNMFEVEARFNSVKAFRLGMSKAFKTLSKEANRIFEAIKQWRDK